MSEFSLVKLEIFIPEEYVRQLGEALSHAGAGRLGNYEQCMSAAKVRGYWRPLEGATPTIGTAGKLETADEIKVEINCPYELIEEAIRVIREVHPYEEPLIQVVPLLNDRFIRKDAGE